MMVTGIYRWLESVLEGERWLLLLRASCSPCWSIPLVFHSIDGVRTWEYWHAMGPVDGGIIWCVDVLVENRWCCVRQYCWVRNSFYQTFYHWAMFLHVHYRRWSNIELEVWCDYHSFFFFLGVWYRLFCLVTPVLLELSHFYVGVLFLPVLCPFTFNCNSHSFYYILWRYLIGYKCPFLFFVVFYVLEQCSCLGCFVLPTGG